MGLKLMKNSLMIEEVRSKTNAIWLAYIGMLITSGVMLYIVYTEISPIMIIFPSLAMFALLSARSTANHMILMVSEITPLKYLYIQKMYDTLPVTHTISTKIIELADNPISNHEYDELVVLFKDTLAYMDNPDERKNLIKLINAF